MDPVSGDSKGDQAIEDSIRIDFDFVVALET